MKIVHSIAEMRALSESVRGAWKRIGFVPTMGYLHDGHLALVERAREKSDVVVASIFVNPTQFAPSEDLATYPRDPEGDAHKLESAGCDVLFRPTPAEIYPEGFSTFVTVNGLAARYEGAHRPTHFRGVATIVAKLFNIVSPHVAVFGQKDAQQVAVIGKMIRDLDFDIRLIVVDTVREPDGLAMSSRNVYLSSEDRQAAVSISRALGAAREAIAAGATVEEATERMRGTLAPEVALDYAEIVNADSFEPATFDNTSFLAIIAGRVGRTRLIDNMRLERNNGNGRSR